MNSKEWKKTIAHTLKNQTPMVFILVKIESKNGSIISIFERSMAWILESKDCDNLSTNCPSTNYQTNLI